MLKFLLKIPVRRRRDARLEDVSLWLAMLGLIVLQSLWNPVLAARAIPESGSGALFLLAAGEIDYEAAPMLETAFDVEVGGLLAQTRLVQRFQNVSDRWVDAVYVFPLPEDAAVHELELVAGERRIRGEIQPRGQARTRFEQARAAGQRSALVEQQRPNLFTTRVANLAPGETLAVTLTYQQTLSYRDGTFELRIPLTLTPRYIPGVVAPEAMSAPEGDRLWQGGWARPTPSVPDADQVTPPMVWPLSVAEGSHRAHVQVQVNAGLPLVSVQSPTHALEVTGTLPAGMAQIDLAEGPVLMDRDLVLQWGPAREAAPQAALFRERWADEDYLMLMVLPGLPAAEQVLPRELILVVDTSGSMAGESLRQAKSALHKALDSLSPQDRFNLIEFNSTTSAWHAMPQPVTAAQLVQARRWIANLEANGGTEMAPALAAALRTPRTAGYVRQVVFLTDGSVGNEAALVEQIDTQLGEARLFTVGMGSAPNRHFLRESAARGRGTFAQIDTQAQVVPVMTRLFERLQAPLLSGVQILDAGLDVYPRRAGDLYAGEPLLLAVRAADAPALLALAGQVRDGTSRTPWLAHLRLAEAAPAPGIHRFWARSALQTLENAQGLGQGDEALQAQGLALAMKHGLVSAWTSLVAVEEAPVGPLDTPVAAQAVASVMPAGSTQGFPATATPAGLWRWAGCVLLGLAAWLYGRQRRGVA